MGKLLLYKPTDILYELIRTQLYGYYSSKGVNGKPMNKVQKRVDRIN